MSITAAPSLMRLEHKNLREQARGVLRTSITTGELEPGVLYTIGSFAEKLGVSATPVREALGDLAQVGLVEIIRNRGFLVPELTDHDLEEIFQLRLMLEPPALLQVSRLLSQNDLDASAELVAQGKAAAVSGDLILFLEADRKFHLGLIARLGNERLVKVLSQLRDQTRLYGLPELAATGKLLISALEHEAILNAVKAGEAAQIRETITTHLSHTRGAWAGRVEDTT